MPAVDTLRRYLAELVVVFVDVALALAVENLREDLSEQAAGEQYLHGFREDFVADLAMLLAQYTAPNRNTMNEVLSSGSLRLIRDAEIRSKLLNLYTTYDRIGRLEEHMARDSGWYRPKTDVQLLPTNRRVGRRSSNL